MREKLLFTHDDFEIVARHSRNAHSLPSHDGEKPAMTAWGMLAKGKTLGKRVVIQTPGGRNGTVSTVDMLSIQDEDVHAQQVCLTLAPPEVFTNLPAVPADLQSLSGSQDNIVLARTTNNAGGDVTTPIPNGLDLEFFNPFVIIEWGIGGVSCRAEADVHNGLCLNLSCSFLRVKAAIDAPAALTSNIMSVAAFVGPGFPKPNNAQRTILIDSTEINIESPVMTVPRFAKSVVVTGCNTNHDLPSGTLRFYRNQGGVNTVADIFFSGAGPQKVDVPNGAYYFTWVPGTAAGAGTNFYQATFELAI